MTDDPGAVLASIREHRRHRVARAAEAVMLVVGGGAVALIVLLGALFTVAGMLR